MDSWTNFGFYNIFRKKFECFSRPKKIGKVRKIFSGPKNLNIFVKKKHWKVNENLQNQNFDFSKMFQNFDFSLTFHSKIIFRTFPNFFFGLEKFSKTFRKNIIKSKICSGIQKSYLENRTGILKLFKIKNPVFLHRLRKYRTVPYTVTYTDP